MKHYFGLKVALLSICLCFGLIACTPFGGFKPPPKWWTYFKGNGASEEEIRIALLECGSDVPGNSWEFPRLPEEFFRDDGRSTTTSVSQCMINSGFRFNGRTPICATIIDTRTGLPIPPFPACMPGWLPTQRSAENRLNSAYCKTLSLSRWCQPVVVSEAQWDEMHKEEWEAQRKRRQPFLDELHKQGYRTDSIALGSISYCIGQAKENTPAQGKLMPYFEKCMKEKQKVWHPEFCYFYRVAAYAACVEIPEDEAKIPRLSTQEMDVLPPVEKDVHPPTTDKSRTVAPSMKPKSPQTQATSLSPAEQLLRENLKQLQRAQDKTQIKPHSPPVTFPVTPKAPNPRLEQLKRFKQGN